MFAFEFFTQANISEKAPHPEPQLARTAPLCKGRKRSPGWADIYKRCPFWWVTRHVLDLSSLLSPWQASLHR